MVGSPVIGPESVESVLKRRGFAIEKRGNLRHALIPLEAGNLGGDQINRFRELFGKYTFRKLVRQVISGRGGATIDRLGGTAGAQADEYVGFLAELEVAEVSGDTVALTRKVNNIGPTLEWYVADLCKTAFDGSSDWSVWLADAEYNDYDVLAWLPPMLMYVETKSSAPDGITESELRHFLQRGEELAPELAVLLVDTDQELDGLVG